jgi:hypothetical protein
MANKTKTPKHLTGEIFDALPAARKREIRHKLEQPKSRQIKSQFRPLTAVEKREHFHPLSKAGRPRLGTNGAEIISLTVEKELLRQANAFAKAQGMKRSELFSRSVRQAMRDGLKAG